MYISFTSCISPQATHTAAFLEGEIAWYEQHQYWAQEPKYKGMIPLNLLRRMSKAVRMSVGAGLPLIEAAGQLDGVIIGSANGSVKNSVDFLEQMITYNEGTLTPTKFVQSTSNSIAGTLALMGKVTGYNNTHVSTGLAFESALLDAWLILQEQPEWRLLVGGVEELSQSNYNIDERRKVYKAAPMPAQDLLKSQTPGTVAGEGAALFVVEGAAREGQLGRILDVDQICYPSSADLTEKIEQFLSRNALTAADIDTVFLGRNGDQKTDAIYDEVTNQFFPDQDLLVYKHLVGEYYTVQSVALWMATHWLNGKTLPETCFWRKGTRTAQEKRTILLYNQYEGIQHSFILLQSI